MSIGFAVCILHFRYRTNAYMGKFYLRDVYHFSIRVRKIYWIFQLFETAFRVSLYFNAQAHSLAMCIFNFIDWRSLCQIVCLLDFSNIKYAQNSNTIDLHLLSCHSYYCVSAFTVCDKLIDFLLAMWIVNCECDESYKSQNGIPRNDIHKCAVCNCKL